MNQTPNWVFTWNNPDYEEEQPNVWPDVRYAVWQHEVGEQGTPHYQGYVVFKANKRLSWLVKNLPHGIHWMPRRGSHEEARDYAQKEDTRTDGPFVFGEEPKQGKRNDLVEIAEYMRSHTMKETAETYPSHYIRYSRGLTEYKQIMTPDRDHLTDLTIYWGPPGTGKTTLVKEENPDAFWLKRGRSGEPWWDGYDGQDTVVIDEFYGWISVDTMSRLVCFSPMMVEHKGKSVKFISKHIIIMSNKDPYQWWSCELHGMKRRLDEATIYYVPDFISLITPHDADYPPRIDLPFYNAQR